MKIYKEKKLSHVSFASLIAYSFSSYKHLIKDYIYVYGYDVFMINRYRVIVFTDGFYIFAVSLSFIKSLGYSLENLPSLRYDVFLANILEREDLFQIKTFYELKEGDQLADIDI